MCVPTKCLLVSLAATIGVVITASHNPIQVSVLYCTVGGEFTHGWVPIDPILQYRGCDQLALSPGPRPSFPSLSPSEGLGARLVINYYNLYMCAILRWVWHINGQNIGDLRFSSQVRPVGDLVKLMSIIESLIGTTK